MATLNEDDIFDLERTIHQWLDTLPSDEDILDYATQLSEDDSSALYLAVESYFLVLFSRKDHYFTKANCEEFVQDISVIDQIEALGNLAQFSPASVMRNLSKTYPVLANLILPNDIAAWSQSFLQKLDAGVKLTTAQLYSKGRLYLNSLIKTQDNGALREMQKHLKELFMREGEAFDTGRAISQSDINEWQQFYTSLKFLPKEQAEDLARPESYFDRLEFNTMLLDIFELIIDSEADPSMEAALWRMAQWRVLRGVVLEQESKRRAKTGRGKQTAEVYEKLNDIWTEENIRNGQTVGPTRALLDQTRGKVIPIDLRKFLEDNLEVEAALDPLHAPSVVSNIAEAPNNADAEIYITQVTSDEVFDLEQRAYLKMLLHQIAQLLRGMDAGQPKFEAHTQSTANA